MKQYLNILELWFANSVSVQVRFASAFYYLLNENSGEDVI